MNNLKTTLLLAALTGLLLAVGNLFAGRTGMLFMLVVSMGMNFFSYWYSDKFVLKMYKAREVSMANEPMLVGIVATLARRGNLPMPKVCIIDTDTPNAFATGRDPEHAAVAVTTALMRVLTPEELEGVIAHELAHVKNRDTLISSMVATIAGVIVNIAHMAQWAMIFGRGNDEENGLGGLLEMVLLIVAVPIAATLIQMGISRSREYEADSTGAKLSGKPLALASALQKIEAYANNRVMAQAQASPSTAHLFIINPLSGASNVMSSLFRTHPLTAMRVAKLQDLAKNMR